MKTTKMSAILVLALGLTMCWARVSEAAPMGTAFTYQGRLIDANSAANGLYDFQFKLFDDPCTGSLIAGPVNEPNLDVIDGYFTVELDFGSSVFNGDARWLEIDVRPGDPCEYTILSPRQEITPVPYALQTRGIFVDNAGKVGMGTTSPAARLEVVGSVRWGNPEAAQGTLGYGTTVVVGSRTNYPLRLVTNNTERVLVDTAGNVGIGTTSPQWPLHIVRPSSVSGIRLDNSSGAQVKVYATILGEIGTVNDTPLSISTNNFSRIYIDTAGNVGVGTDSPGTKLHVYEPSSSDVYMSVEASSSDGEAGVQLRNPAGGWDVFANNDDGDFAIAAHALSDRVLTIKNTTGNVGIGTTNPGERLEVVGSVRWGNPEAAQGTLGYGTTVVVGSRTNYPLRLVTNNTERVLVDTAGNVGIGTTSPQWPLHIVRPSSVSGIRLDNSSGAQVKVYATILGEIGTVNDTPLSISTNNFSRIYIDTAGNVGVGTDSPSYPLEMGSGAHCTAGGVWTDASSVVLKENFSAVDTGEILAKVQELPVRRWNYKAEDATVQHMGPVAEDFHALFGLGDSDKAISGVDRSGVALAAIQGLHKLAQEKDAEIAELKARLATVEAAMAKLTKQQEGGL